MGAARQLADSGIWDIFDLAPVAGSDVQSYLDLTLAKCVAWFRASGGSIFLENDGNLFKLRSRCGHAMELPDSATIRSGQGIGGVVVQSGVGRIVNDPAKDKELAGQPGNQRIKSAMVIPLVDTKSRTIGVLNISRRNGERPFVKSDLEQAMALGSHLALAVSNAEILAALQNEVYETELARERLEAVLDSVAGAVVVVDQTGSIVTFNETARPVVEYQVDLSTLVSGLQSAISNTVGSTEETKKPVYDARSDRTWVITGVPLASSGAVLTVQEWTEHERHERENARVNRLAEIGQMTAAIAHEIRNPLTGIRSAAQMIRQHPDTLNDFIGMIEEEALKLNSLCDEFLEFAKPISLNRQETTLGEIVQSQIDLMRWSFDEKEVELRGVISFDQPRYHVDGRKIGQVVLNLLRNALDASVAGTSVLCEVKNGRISVIDSGAGISPEDLGKLFSPFFTTKADGTGLGLCNAKKVIDAHGGSIKVISEIGRGTTFEIELDRNEI